MYQAAVDAQSPAPTGDGESNCGDSSHGGARAVEASIARVRTEGLFYVRDKAMHAFQVVGSAPGEAAGSHTAVSDNRNSSGHDNATSDAFAPAIDARPSLGNAHSTYSGYSSLFAGPTGGARALILGDYGIPQMEVRLRGYRRAFGSSFSLDTSGGSVFELTEYQKNVAAQVRFAPTGYQTVAVKPD